MGEGAASTPDAGVRQTAGHAKVLLLLGVLYAAQGIPMGLAFTALPAILRTLGHAPETIGMLGVVALPWAAKFLWAPLVDRYGGRRLGRRRSWIIPAQIMAAAIYLLLGATHSQEPGDLWPIVAGLLCINLIAATQDIATDGLAVEALDGGALAWANGLQIGAFMLGMTIGGGATILLFDAAGWRCTFTVLGLLTGLSLAVTLLVPEPQRTADDRSQNPAGARASIGRMLRRPGAGLMLSVAALFHLAHAMIYAMTGPFLVDAGIPLADIGLLNSLSLLVIPVIGAAIGSVLASRYGAAGSAVALGTVGVLALLLWLVPGWTMHVTFASALAITCTIGLAAYAAYVAFFTVFMQWSSVEQAGTDFSILQCSETIVGILAAALAGQIVGQLGFLALFIVTPIIGLAAMAWIFVALRRLRLQAASRGSAPAAAGHVV